MVPLPTAYRYRIWYETGCCGVKLHNELDIVAHSLVMKEGRNMACVQKWKVQSSKGAIAKSGALLHTAVINKQGIKM